jgi:hypothetical protein
VILPFTSPVSFPDPTLPLSTLQPPAVESLSPELPDSPQPAAVRVRTMIPTIDPVSLPVRIAALLSISQQLVQLTNFDSD